MNTKHHYLPFHFHRHHWNIEVIEYYSFQLLSNIANSTLNLFVPIYLLTIGYNLWHVALFYTIYQLWIMFSMPFVGKMVQKIGVKHAMALHLPFAGIYYFGLQHLSGSFLNDLWLILLILGLKGFFRNAYHVADNLFISKHLFKEKKSGKNLALIKIIFVLAGIISPLVGGVIAYFFGFDVVFNAGIVMVLLAGLPLLITHDKYFKLGYNPKQIYSISLHQADRHFLIAEIGRVLPDTMMWMMWPLFIYFVVKNTANMGILVSLSALISMIIAYYVGKFVDQKNPEKMLKKTVKGATGLFFLRAFSLHPLLIGLVDVANNVLSPILQIPYDFYVYRMVKQHPNQIEISNIKQLITEGIYTIGMFLLLPITYFFPEPSSGIFITIFASSALLILLMQAIVKVGRGTIPNS